MFRRLCELGLALIVSKLAIGLAFAVGAVALGAGDAADTGASAAGGAGMSLAGLLGGATLMGLAAFTPFVVLRLLPLLETAAVAQGISRSPARGAQTAMTAAAYPTRLARLAGGMPMASGGASGVAKALPSGPGRNVPLAAVGPADDGRRRLGAGSGPGRRVTTPPGAARPAVRPPRRSGDSS
jgi:hypothetical protein